MSAELPAQTKNVRFAIRPPESAASGPVRELSQLVRTLGRDLRERLGVRVHKIALDAGFTCPNRDGGVGRGGCTFCVNESFAPAAAARPPLVEQVAAGAAVIGRRTGAERFLAYFQAYSNTYAPLERLEALYREALALPGVVGISVGTRPDCLEPGALELLAALQAEGHEVWLELGLQSAFDPTLERIRRGHGADIYFEQAARARALGLRVCTHLILGLPGEGLEHALATHERVVRAGVDGLKLHPLHVVRGSVLAREWRDGFYRPLDLATYVAWAANLIERTPPDVVFHRLTGTCGADLLLAPAWCERKWIVLNGIEAELRRRGTRQGSRVS